MRSRTVVIITAVVLAAIGLMWWRSTGLVDRSIQIERRMVAVFSKFGITEDDVVRSSTEEKKSEGRRYVSTYAEYNVSGSFSWKGFETALKDNLQRTPFRIIKDDQVSRKDRQYYTVVIGYGKLDVLTLKFNKRKATRAEVRVEPQPEIRTEKPVKIHTESQAAASVQVLPALTVKKVRNPRVAIVMDDFGYNMNDFELLFDTKQPITLAILPEQQYTRDIAELARSRGYEVILHLPLEAKSKNASEENDTIKTGMSDREVITKLTNEIAAVPGLKGVSNHQGSMATEDRKLMTTILKNLRSKRLYFFDSLTSNASVCGEVATATRVRYARRDIFLDNSNDIADIEKEVLALRDLAFRRGSAIAICHDRKNTLIVLNRMMPELAKDGMQFVSLSDMVK